MGVNESTREEYVARVNRVVDYIEANLAEPMTLDGLARVASFSPYHFHRIFNAMMGETLSRFITRIRLERAAVKLTTNPKEPVTNIAFDCGFSSSAVFARNFKAFTGMSATEWRETGGERSSKNRKTNSKSGKPMSNVGKEFTITTSYDRTHGFVQKWRVEMKGDVKLAAEVEVKELDEMHVAYVRHIGPYQGNGELFGQLFGKLAAWAGPRGLMSEKTQALTIYHDNCELTDADKLRISVCFTVPEETEVDGDIGKTTVAAGKYAVAKFELDPSRYGEAWEAIFGGWLPVSGYQPDDRPALEVYLGDPKEHPEGKHVFEIRVPVRPM